MGVEQAREFLCSELSMLLDGFEDPQQEVVEDPQQEVVIQPVGLINGYGVDNPHIFNLIKEQTPCWGKFTDRDEVCKTCPLSTLCESHKVFTKESRKSSKESLESLMAELEELGFDGKIKGFEMEGKIFKAQGWCSCSISGIRIPPDEDAFMVKGVGVVQKAVFEISNLKA